MIYAATHVALALLEHLVHLNPERLPSTMRAFAIDLPEDAAVERGSLAPGDTDATRRFGDGWIASLRAAALIVPSILIPETLSGFATDERNVLLNPRHTSASMAGCRNGICVRSPAPTSGLTSPPRGRRASHPAYIRPGLSTPSGSNAAFTRRAMAASAAGSGGRTSTDPRSAAPRSKVQVPPA